MSQLISFLGLKFCTNVKNKYEKGILNPFFLLRKKSLGLQKNLKIMLEHFPIGF
jgi:hypothetical protein